MTDFAPFTIEEVLFVQLDDEVAHVQLRLEVRGAQTDYVCELEYGLNGNCLQVPISGISPWQALLLGLKTLFRELKRLESQFGGEFYLTEKDALAGKSPWSVEDIFFEMTPSTTLPPAPK